MTDTETRSQIVNMIAAHFEVDSAPIVIDPIGRLVDRILALLRQRELDAPTLEEIAKVLRNSDGLTFTETAEAVANLYRAALSRETPPFGRNVEGKL